VAVAAVVNVAVDGARRIGAEAGVNIERSLGAHATWMVEKSAMGEDTSFIVADAKLVLAMTHLTSERHQTCDAHNSP